MRRNAVVDGEIARGADAKSDGRRQYQLFSGIVSVLRFESPSPRQHRLSLNGFRLAPARAGIHYRSSRVLAQAFQTCAPYLLFRTPKLSVPAT